MIYGPLTFGIARKRGAPRLQSTPTTCERSRCPRAADGGRLAELLGIAVARVVGGVLLPSAANSLARFPGCRDGVAAGLVALAVVIRLRRRGVEVVGVLAGVECAIGRLTVALGGGCAAAAAAAREPFQFVRVGRTVPRSAHVEESPIVTRERTHCPRAADGVGLAELLGVALARVIARGGDLLPIAASGLTRVLGLRDGIGHHAIRGSVDRVGGDPVIGVQARVARISSRKATECGDAGDEQGEQKSVHRRAESRAEMIKNNKPPTTSAKLLIR